MSDIRNLITKIDQINNEGTISAASRLVPGLGFASNAYDLYNGEYLKAGLGLIANTLELFTPTYPLGAGMNVAIVGHDIHNALNSPDEKTNSAPGNVNPTDAGDREKAIQDIGSRLSGGRAKAVAQQTPNVVADPEAANSIASQTTPPTEQEISAVVGDKLSPDAISKLASAAEQYALPAAAIVALLYGGKTLYDYITAKTKQKVSPKHSIAEMMEIVRTERSLRETI